MWSKLTVNGQFMRDFLDSRTPCCALGVIEDHARKTGLLTLRLNEIIPPEVADRGFGFGNSLFGTSAFEVVHFAFDFYEYKTYNILINPNNPIAQTVLSLMVESGGYFFFLIEPGNKVTAYRSELGENTLIGLTANIPRIQHSRTTETEYQKAVSHFSKNPDPPGEMLHWVCRDDARYLDLTRDRLELNSTR
jgi:hypothetical protein